jgi:hypothetical protein
MMHIKKILAVSIIFLFIGVAVAPGINQSVVTASLEDDVVEVTTQACGIQGYGDTTVKMTRQQYQDLEQYLVEFKARLNQTTTREEAIPIYKEAVVELDLYGLLPKGMSVEKAQMLVTGEYLNERMMNVLEKNAKKRMTSNDENYLCLTVGTIYRSLLTTPLIIASIPFLLFFMFWIIGEFIFLGRYPLLEVFLTFLVMPCVFIAGMSIILSYECPVSMIVYGKVWGCDLSTIGLLGLQTIKKDAVYGEGYKSAIYGFTGLKILVSKLNFESDFSLLGFSLAITDI